MRTLTLCLCLAVLLSRCFLVCARSVSVRFAPMMGLNFSDSFFLCLCLAVFLSCCLSVCALSVSVMFAPMMRLNFSDALFMSVPGCPSVALSSCLCSLRLCHVCPRDGSEIFRPSLCVCAWLSFCRVVFLSVLSPSLSCLLP